MDWLEIGNQIFQLVVSLVIPALAAILIAFISKQIKQSQDKIDNELVYKYLGMLDKTVTSAVLATTQTYVEALKNEQAFDKEAQEKAFQMTYEAVMKVLTDEAKLYITSAVGDLQTYITNQIEATVKTTK